jgi:hypothetical protein
LKLLLAFSLKQGQKRRKDFNAGTIGDGTVIDVIDLNSCFVFISPLVFVSPLYVAPKTSAFDTSKSLR